MTIATNATGSTNCLPLGLGKEDGHAIVTKVDGVAVSGTPPGLTFVWTGPTTTTPPFPVGVANNAGTLDLKNVQGGLGYDYTVVVTRQTDGCQVTKAVNVPDSKALPLLSLVKTDNTICNAAQASS